MYGIYAYIDHPNVGIYGILYMERLGVLPKTGPFKSTPSHSTTGIDPSCLRSCSGAGGVDWRCADGLDLALHGPGKHGEDVLRLEGERRFSRG